MIFARVAVAGAILTTLWFNGSYAWGKGGSVPQQLAMVALAVTIDAAKCGFLAAASTLWRQGWRFPPFVLVLLWAPCLAYSTFAAYALLTTNRDAANVAHRAAATVNTTAHQAYQAATEALATARQSPEWSATAACTVPRTSRQRTYCDNIDDLTQRAATATTALNDSTPVTADPEIGILAAVFGLPPATVLLTIALWPAVLLELTASLGFYVINRPPYEKPPGKPSASLSSSPAPDPATQANNEPKARLDAPTAHDAGSPRAQSAISWPSVKPS